MRKGFHLVSIVAVLIISALGLFPGGTALAAGETVVTVSAPNEVQPGEVFTVNIDVEPGSAIAGLQFNLAFDTSLVDANNVTEGNLLSQNGTATYFSPGTINNTAGNIIGVAGAITTPGQSVAAPGTFAVISFTAGTQVGTSALTLSNVIAGNTNGQPVAVITVNGEVGIGEAADGGGDDGGGSGGGTGGGGGGGGGGGSSGGGSISGITSLRNSISSSGSLMEDISATDIDCKIEVQISRGTIVLNQNGQPPSSIRITPKVNNYSSAQGTEIISEAYEIEPSGTTFNPGATLIYRYSESEIPQGMSPENLFLARWDTGQAQWIELDSGVDVTAHRVFAPIQHLSIYALLAHNRPAEFEFSDFSSSSSEVAPGQPVTFSVFVTNTGDATGSCDVTLKLDGIVEQIIPVTLGSGEGQTVTFNVTPPTDGEHTASVGSLSVTFAVREILTPSNFMTSNLSIYPPEIDLGDSISVSILVTNTGDLPGTYHAVLRVANTEQASADIEIAGAENKNVSFSFTPEAAGDYTVILGGLQSAFSVRPLSVVEPVVPELKINDFQIMPTYDPESNKLVLTRIDYQLDGTREQIAGSELTLRVYYEGEILEEIPLLSLEGTFEGNTGSCGYIPATGWKAGSYQFQMELYQGGVNLQGSEQRQFTVTPEAIAAVFSWNILAIIIGIAMGIAAILVTLTVVRRREMLRS